MSQFDDVIAEVVAGLESAGEPVGKIAAIKGLRERTGIGLKAAKDAVEEYGRRRQVDSLVKPEVNGSGCLLALALLVFAALGVALILLKFGPRA